MKKSIPFGKERNDFSLSINSIWWNVYSIWKGEGWLFAVNKQYLMKRFDEMVYSILKGEGWLFAIDKQYLKKRSIPFGKERDDFSLSINSIWWKGLFHLERSEMNFSLSINSIWWKSLFHLQRRVMTFRYQ